MGAATGREGGVSVAKSQRTIRLKLYFDWRDESSRLLHHRLRYLAWQETAYRNGLIRRLWAEAMGWRVRPEDGDKHDITKQGRRVERGELSSAALDGASREVMGVWHREAKRVLSGAPLPAWGQDSAFSLRGQRPDSDVGAKIELEHDAYVLYVQAQSKDMPDGSWMRLALARNTRSDKHYGDALMSMAARQTRILAAKLRVKQRGAVAWLTYAKDVAPTQSGVHVATLGPVTRDGGLKLRTEFQTKDYTSKLAQIMDKKDGWDLIRRRVTAQIGWRKGQARKKRILLSRMSWADWLDNYLHVWTRQVSDWLFSQKVRALEIASLETLDWPAFRFKALLKYKLEERGIEMRDAASVDVPSGERAAQAEVKKVAKAISKRQAALRELEYQTKKQE